MSSLMTKLHNMGRNAASDECYTPPAALQPLLPYLPKDKVIFEPTSEKSSLLVGALEGAGHIVLPYQGDFLTEVFGGFDIIVTNPPYSKKDAFISRCYEYGAPFALLLPVATLQGIARGKLFKEYGISVIVLTKRVDFTGKKAPAFGVAWFCYGLLDKDLVFYDNS